MYLAVKDAYVFCVYFSFLDCKNAKLGALLLFFFDYFDKCNTTVVN